MNWPSIFHWSALIGGYGALWLFCAFVMAFAWGTLRDKQRARERIRRLARAQMPPAFPGPIIVHLSFGQRMEKKPKPVDQDISDMLRQIAEQH